MNRRLPVPWWQRPQFWRWERHPRDPLPALFCPARAMWSIRETMGPLPDGLGQIRPGDGEPAEYGPKD